MSRRPQNSAGIAQPIPGPLVLSGFRKAVIAKINPDGTIDEGSKSLGKLLLNPESLEDSKTSNWVANNIPGQSDPIYQWVSGGARTITFDALVTKDTSEVPYLKSSDDPLAGVIDSSVNAIGSIASNFAGANLPPAADLFNSLKGNTSGTGEELSIEAQLNYYRSLLYPIYAQGRLATSPPLIVLYFGKSLGSLNTVADTTISEENDIWILTELRIRITKQLPNLTPMEATCSFRFNQYAIKSLETKHFIAIDQGASVPSGGSIGQTISGFFK